MHHICVLISTAVFWRLSVDRSTLRYMVVTLITDHDRTQERLSLITLRGNRTNHKQLFVKEYRVTSRSLLPISKEKKNKNVYKFVLH